MVFEIWKTLQEYPFYKISNAGRVMKLKKGIWEECKYHKDNKGYIRVTVRNSRGEFANIGVHRLVATAFIFKPDKNLIVNHLDENPSNNRADNLEWTTYSGNSSYSARRNPQRINKTSSIPIVQTTMSGKLIGRWESVAQASKTLDLPYKPIRACCRCVPRAKHPVGNCWWIYEDEWKIREKIMSGFAM